MRGGEGREKGHRRDRLHPPGPRTRGELGCQPPGAQGQTCAALGAHRARPCARSAGLRTSTQKPGVEATPRPFVWQMQRERPSVGTVPTQPPGALTCPGKSAHHVTSTASRACRPVSPKEPRPKLTGPEAKSPRHPAATLPPGPKVPFALIVSPGQSPESRPLPEGTQSRAHGKARDSAARQPGLGCWALSLPAESLTTQVALPPQQQTRVTRAPPSRCQNKYTRESHSGPLPRPITCSNTGPSSPLSTLSTSLPWGLGTGCCRSLEPLA